MVTNEQKLLDFISDKKKLHLKSCFDQKGSKDFLSKKNEAMEKIELNETIEDIKMINGEKLKKIKTDEDNNKLKIKKKMSKKKSHIIKKSENLKKLSEEEFGLNNEDIESKPYHHNHKNAKKSSKNTHKVIFFSELKEKNKLEDESTEANMATKITKESKIISSKSNNKKLKEKINNNIINKKNLKETKISIESIDTVDSKLFNNKKDYEHYKHFCTKDDNFIKEIVEQLKSNNNIICK